MSTYGLRAMPVVEHGYLAGIATRRDVLQAAQRRHRPA
jgi:CBS domain-containing protein